MRCALPGQKIVAELDWGRPPAAFRSFTRQRSPSLFVHHRIPNTCSRVKDRMSVCDTCRRCILKTLRFPGGPEFFLHHRTVQDLNANVAQSCQICDFILRIGTSRRTSPAGDSVILSEDRPWCRLGSHQRRNHDLELILICHCRDTSFSRRIGFRGIKLKEVRELPAINRTGGMTSGSPESIHNVQAWARKCQTRHKLCRRLSTPSRYPSRLLDLHAIGSQPIPFARLSVTAEQTVSGPYNTLSHCWGPESFLCLSKENLNQFRKEIPVSKLTKSFQQAIDFTRRLGVRYL